MQSINYILQGIKSLTQQDIFVLMISLISFSMFYFFILKVNHKRKLQTRSDTSTIFYSYLVFLIFSIVFYIINICIIYTNSKAAYTNQLLSYLYSNTYIIVNITVVIFLLYVLYKIVFSKIKIRVKRAYQERVSSFKVIPKKENKITQEMMNDIPNLYSFDGENKKYLFNHKVPKLTKLEKPLRKSLTYFQMELLKYMLNITEQNIEDIQERYYEFEILRLTQLSIELQKDLIIGQFRSIVKEEKDSEILGAIYNLREKNITNEGYAYFMQYIKKTKQKREHNE